MGYSCETYVQYIQNCSNKHLRRVIAQFWAGSHRLYFGTGRHQGIARQDRICQMCNHRVSNPGFPAAHDQFDSFDSDKDADIYVVEVGFCMETAYMTKYQEKHAQHQQLITHLWEAGYADVKLHLLIFGNTGGMFHLTAQHLKQLGITSNCPQVRTVGSHHMHMLSMIRHRTLCGTHTSS